MTPQLTSAPTWHLSVAICTYNGEHRLTAVLSALQQQQAASFAWEVIVVDNNSQDGTAEVVTAFQSQWAGSIPLRYAFERKQGAGFARHHAARIARAPLLGFLDDDTIPEQDWVRQAYAFGQAYPQAGVYGSRIRGEFESTPPPNFERIAAYLALTERGEKPLIYAPHQKVLPPSAGMVVRRQAWLEHVPDEPVLSGRAGSSMLTGEDLEAILHIQRAGWQVWYNPAMRLRHQIPTARLQRPYLISMFRGIGLSRHRTRMLSFPAWQRPLVLPAYLLNDLRKILRHWLRYGRRVIADPVTASEMNLYVYSLVSPFYLWQRGARRAIAKRLRR